MFRQASLFAATAFLLAISRTGPVAAQDTGLKDGTDPLVLSQSIPLPQITGNMNHLDADAKRQRFFITAPGEKKLVVVDLKAGKVLRILDGSAAAVRFLPDLDQLCVADRSGITFYDGDSLTSLGKVETSGSVDELQYDSNEKRLYAGIMDANNPGIAVIDVSSMKSVAQFKLPTKPQGFVVESAGTRIYANTPGADQVTVIDRKQTSVVAEWKLTEARSNYPIALDEANHRLFVGCRRPAKLLVLDAASGKTITSVETGGDADDMAFDAASKRVYLACGDGVITTVKEIDPDHYRRLPDISTAENARNAQFVNSLKTLYLAVPRQEKAPTELRAYRAVGSASNDKPTK